MNPLSIITKKDIKIKIENKPEFYGNIAPAAVAKLGDRDYLIMINDSILNNFTGDERKILDNGLKLHELAHIEYDSMLYSSDDPILSTIDNILEDMRIEYNLSTNYPIAAKYFSLTLKLMKSYTKLENNNKNDKLTNDEIDFNTKMKDLYNLVRYDEIPKDEEYANFLLPLVLLAKRSERKTCANIGCIIYDYLMYYLDKNEANKKAKDGKPQTNPKNRKAKKPNFNKKENIQEIVNELNDELKEEITNMAKDIKKVEISNKQSQENNNDSGKRVSIKVLNKDREDLQSCIKSMDFYYKTVKNNLLLIRELEIAFKKKLNKDIIVKSKDGDMNIKPLNQMNAYIDSFTHEENYNYLKNKKIETQFDVILFRDVSWSTSQIKNEYAETLICLMESLSKFRYVNIAAVDFGSSGKIIKRFEDKLPGVIPITTGTTNLADALKIAYEELQWRNRKRYIIIITDGSPDCISSMKEELSNKFYNEVELIPLIVKSDISLFKNDIHINELKDIPKKIMEVLS